MLAGFLQKHIKNFNYSYFITINVVMPWVIRSLAIEVGPIPNYSTVLPGSFFHINPIFYYITFHHFSQALLSNLFT